MYVPIPGDRMIDIEFKGRGYEPIQTSFEILVRDVQPTGADIAKAGEFLVTRTRNNTQSGLDFEGIPFAAYSPATALKKKSSIVTLYGDHNGPHMLDALTYRNTDTSLEVGVFGNEQIATKAKVLNEGAQIRTRYGTGGEGFKTKPGRRRHKVLGKELKSVSTIPARQWLGASDSDLTTMASIIANSAMERIKTR